MPQARAAPRDAGPAGSRPRHGPCGSGGIRAAQFAYLRGAHRPHGANIALRAEACCHKHRRSLVRPCEPRHPRGCRGGQPRYDWGTGGVKTLGEAARHSPRQMRPVESSGNEEGTVQCAREMHPLDRKPASPEGVELLFDSARHTTRETKVARELHTWHRRARSGLPARRRRTHSAGGRGVAYG